MYSLMQKSSWFKWAAISSSLLLLVLQDFREGFSLLIVAGGLLALAFD